MSFYGHRCLTCGHRNYEHQNTVCRWYISCPCRTAEYGPSELFPTFDVTGLVERIIVPGDGLRSYGHANYADNGHLMNEWRRPGAIIVPSCDCDECQQMHAERVA